MAIPALLVFNNIEILFVLKCSFHVTNVTGFCFLLSSFSLFEHIGFSKQEYYLEISFILPFLPSSI